MGQFGIKRGPEMPVITLPNENENKEGRTVELTEGLWAELELIKNGTTLAAGKKVSLNQIVRQCINWALEQHWRERGQARPVDPLAALEEFEASKEWQSFLKQKKK